MKTPDHSVCDRMLEHRLSIPIAEVAERSAAANKRRYRNVIAHRTRGTSRRSTLRRQGGPTHRLVVRRAVINNYRRNSGVDVATGAPHSSQNFASGETRWPFKQRLLSSKRST